MKNLPRTLAALVLPAGILLTAAVLVLAKTNDDDYNYNRVTIAEKGILIPLKAKVSEADCAKMNEILQKYDKSLYRIDTYGKGQFVSSQGELKKLCIDKKAYSTLTTDAKNSGLSDCTMQVGALMGPDMVCKIDEEKARELVKKLKPILEKYTK